MKDDEVEEMLDEAAHAPHSVPAAVLERIVGSVGASLEPVRPLLPAPVLSGALVLVVAAIAVLGGLRTGLQGVELLSAAQRLLIFGALLLLTSLVAARTVREWVPGSAARVAGPAVVAGVALVLLAVFALVFHDYRATQFVPAGLRCLVAGTLHAAVAAPLIGWLLRRGYAVHAVSAGLVAGGLAGLAGVSLLELHCPNFEAPHVLVWHVLVVPLSAAVGAGAGWLLSWPQGRLTS